MEKVKTKANQYSYVNWLRVLAACMIIVIHVSSTYTLIAISNMGEMYWSIQNIFASIVRSGVPLFFIITGILTLGNNEEREYWPFVIKRIRKIIIPLIGVGMVYIVYESIITGNKPCVSDLWKLFIQDGPYYHLWYLYLMIPITFLLPILSKMIKQLGRKDIKTLLLITFVFGSVLPYAQLMFNLKINVHSKMILDEVFVYISYFILGYYINTYEIPLKHRICSYVMGVIGVIITIIGTYTVTRGGNLNQVYYEYYSPNVILMSIAILLLYKYNKKINNKTPILIKSLCKCSFGIYLIHPLIINILARRGYIFANENITPLVRIPVFSISVLIISWGIVFLFKQIVDKIAN